jgi:acyl carrier protein
MDILGHITSFIEDTFLFGEKIQITENESLTKNNVLDSTGILEIISFIENRYSFSVQDEEIVPENFDSLQSIRQYIEKKITP